MREGVRDIDDKQGRNIGEHSDIKEEDREVASVVSHKAAVIAASAGLEARKAGAEAKLAASASTSLFSMEKKNEGKKRERNKSVLASFLKI